MEAAVLQVNRVVRMIPTITPLPVRHLLAVGTAIIPVTTVITGKLHHTICIQENRRCNSGVQPSSLQYLMPASASRRRPILPPR